MIRTQANQTEGQIIFVTRCFRYSLITLFIILLFCGYHDVNAADGINSSATDHSLVSPVTTPSADPVFPASQQGDETGDSSQPEAQTAAAEDPQPKAPPCTTVKEDGDNWLDRVHALVQDKACEPAVWFDSFFGKEHILLDLQPGIFIILKNRAHWTEGRPPEYVQDYHISLELPHWERSLKKARLYIESRSESEQDNALPGEPVEPGVDPKTGVKRPVIGVRIDPYTWARSLVRIDSGVRINMHPDAFIRMRYQYLKNLGELYLLRFSDTVMWQAVEHLSNTSQVDLERKINTFAFVRWGNQVTYIEHTPGITWNTGISLFKQLTSRSAISYDARMWGDNYPEWVIQNYRLGVKYRRNFYRRWLFYELEPEVTWPKDDSGSRKAAYAFMATLEVQFGK